MKKLLEMIRKIWQNYLRCGLNEKEIGLFILNQIQFVNFFSVIGVGSLLIFGSAHLLAGSITKGIIDFGFAFIAILNISYLRRSLNFQFAGSVILFFMIFVLIFLLITGGIQRTGIFWYYTFPALAFFLKGKVKGFYYLITLFLLTIFVFTLSQYQIIEIARYKFIEIRQLLISLATVSFLVYFYEKVKNESEKRIRETEKDIILKNIFDIQFQEARDIQRDFIPKKNLNLDRIEIVGYYKPVMEIGGDYFDFFELDSERIAVILCDVSGKGIPAALIMVKIRTFIKTSKELKDLKSDEALLLINDFLKTELRDELFVTFFYLILNRETKKVEFSNAGQGPLTYYSSNDGKVYPLKCKGLPIGVATEEEKYESCEVVLNPGDIIALYTDGLPDTINKNGLIYSNDRIYQDILNLKNLSAEKISNKLIDNVLAFKGEKNQVDDMTLVVLKMN